MKKRVCGAWFSVLSSIVLLAVVLVIWWNYPILRFHLSLLRVSDSAHPVKFEVNTFDDEVSSSKITLLYYAACEKAKAISGNTPVKTFLGFDQFGWERWASIVQLKSCYIEARLLEGNDSQTVTFSIKPGIFDSTDMQLLPDEKIPESVATRISWP